jgi:RimJ/RimL family protein N-acetyltransferase
VRLPLALDPAVETERLTLRVVEARDADAVHAWRSREDVTTYLPYGPQSHAEVVSSLDAQSRLRRLARDGERGVLAAVRRDTREVVGELHLVLRSVAARGFEVGWVFSPEVAGQGFATEAARELLRLAFEVAGAHRVIAELDPRNDASTALCRRLGLREEAHFVQDFRLRDGSWGDTGIWAVLEHEWRGAGR